MSTQTGHPIPVSYVIKHSHGQSDRHDSLEEVWAALRTVYGEEIVAVGDGGWDEVDCDEWRQLGRVLVWSDVASSENDDGQRAVAEISARFADVE